MFKLRRPAAVAIPKLADQASNSNRQTNPDETTDSAAAGSIRALVVLAPIPPEPTDETLKSVAHQMIQLLRRRTHEQK
jgi:hypothetical protein